MEYLDTAELEALEDQRHREVKPYPFWNPRGLLTPSGFERLMESLPPIERFENQFGVSRKYGQASHDRFTLEYEEQPDLPAPWQAFIGELRGQRYRRFLQRMLGERWFKLAFHWHYTPNGCSISPHCDSRRKAGSHLFYLNTSRDWDPAWGGQTLILDDGGRLDRGSSPDFADFDGEQPVEILDNASALFSAGPHSWHGMREIRCPEGALRRVFIVVVNRDGPFQRAKRRWKGKPSAGY